MNNHKSTDLCEFAGRSIGQILFAIALAAFTVMAYAAPNWKLVHQTSAAAFYVEPSTLREIAGKRRIWMLIDFRSAAEGGTMSIRSLEEYDCVEQRVKSLSQTNHSGNMAEGRVLGGIGTIDLWDFVAPGLPQDYIMKFACAPL